MKSRPQITHSPITFAAISGLAAGFFATPALAYLDPGTGSIIVQGIIAGVAAALAAGGIFWQRIKNAFRSLLGKKEPVSEEPDE